MYFRLFCFSLVCLSCVDGEGFFSKFSNRKKSESGYVNDESVNVCETVKVMPRIAFAVVGGSPLKSENSAPYIAAIGERLSNGSVSWFCGGSLLSQNDILTAAHCLVSRNVTTVRLGSFSTKKRATENDYEISEAIIHPGYKITESYDDVAVVKIKEKISFTQNIKPVCLPENDNDKYDKERAKVIGWGAEEFGGEGTHKLQQVEVQIFKNSECEKAYQNSTIGPKTFPKGIKREQLCAGSRRGGKDACQGDSGGPLVLTDDNGIVRQIGIVSTGAGCGIKKYPGVYARVSSYTDWIQEQIRKSGSHQSNQNRNSSKNDQNPRKENLQEGQSSKQRETINTRPLPEASSKGQSSQHTKNESGHDNKPANRTSSNNNNNNNHLSNIREDHNSRERIKNEQSYREPTKSERDFQNETQTGTRNNNSSSSHNQRITSANNNSREHNSQSEFFKNDKLSGLEGNQIHNYNHLQPNGNRRDDTTTLGSSGSRERLPHLHEKPSEYEDNSRPNRRPSLSPTSDYKEESRMRSKENVSNSQANISRERNNLSRETSSRFPESSSREQSSQRG